MEVRYNEGTRALSEMQQHGLLTSFTSELLLLSSYTTQSDLVPQSATEHISATLGWQVLETGRGLLLLTQG